jgi:chloramphenicol-sensitive protein RarD
VFLIGLLAISRGWVSVRIVLRSRRALGLLGIAAIAITTNWTTYVYAVSTDQVVESSLGYFINPLVSVALAVVILRERLRIGQWTAVSIAAIGVAVIAIGAGALPFIGLTLAASFGTYGLVKKIAGVDAVPSLTIETAILFPLAVGVLVVAEVTGRAAFVVDGAGITVLLILLGPVTAIPLLAYVAAANRLPLSTLGITQYLTPTVLFILGLTVFGESVTTLEWWGFILIWAALAVFTIDMARHARRPSRADALDVAEPT